MEEIEVPKYFICPISLQMMRDPVTAVTGITYDRESIEKWLSSTAANDVVTCPVTKQALPRDSELTPNHTLRRLIQAWCIANATKGVEPIPTPKAPLERRQVLQLLRELRLSMASPWPSQILIAALKKIEALAAENERNRRCLAEAGVAKAVASFLVSCFKEGKMAAGAAGVEEALRILRLISPTASEELKQMVNESSHLVESLSWILGHREIRANSEAKSEAVRVLKLAIGAASSTRLERLRLELFMNITKYVLRAERSSPSPSSSSINCGLQVLIEAGPWGRNRLKMIEAGAVPELVELELTKPESRHTTELIFELLAQLCSCADGRAQLVQHAAGVAVVSKRILRVSAATDDTAVHVLSLIAKFSAKKEVVMEMLAVGAVTKLCMVMQADCAPYLKEKARGTLRLHSKLWNDSPCIAVYLLSRHPAR